MTESHIKRWQTKAEILSHRKAQAKYQKDPEQVTKRENRNLARAHMEKLGKVHKGDGKDVGHVDGHALNNSPTNWAVQSRKSNRSYKRTKSAHKKDPTS
jgi:hypothetical protein